MSLLHIHVPNNDRLFPGRQETQVTDFGEGDHEWQVDQILSHVGSGPTATFEVKWMLGDVTWLPYEQLPHLSAMKEYLDLLEIKDITDLPLGDGAPPSDDELINCQVSPDIIIGVRSMSVSHRLLAFASKGCKDRFARRFQFLSTERSINSLFPPTANGVVLEVGSRGFIRGVLEPPNTTYQELALVGSTWEEMNWAVIMILDTNSIQLEKQVNR